MGLSFLSLLYLQVSYIEEMMKTRKEQFDSAVRNSLDQVSKDVEYAETMRWLVEDISDAERKALTENNTSLGQNNVVRGTQRFQVKSRDGKIISDFELRVMKIKPSELPKAMVRGRNTIPQTSNSMLEAIKNRYMYQRALLDEVVLDMIRRASDKSIGDRVRFRDLDDYLKSNLYNNGIDLPYHFAVIDKDGREVYRCADYEAKGSEESYQQALFKNDPPAKMSILKVHFPGKKDYIFDSISFMIPSLIFTLVLLVTFIFTIYIVFRQKKLTEMKNDFVNNMTHEFKTPISTISLAAQMLKDPAVAKSPQMFQHISGVINDETKRLRFQVEKVLQMSMFDRQKATLKMKEIDANELISGVINTFALKVERYNGKITSNLEAADPVIFADEMHLTNVIFNLMDNAVKYKKAEEDLELKVKTWNESGKLMISIQDNGIGIKKENLKYNSTVKDKYTKTGCHHTLHPASSASVGDGQSNITSAKDCGILLEHIYNGTCVSSKYSKEMRKLRLAQTRRWKIPSGIPSGIKVANKTGETSSVEHDMAIVYGKKKDYIICVFSNTGSEDYALPRIRNISRTVYNYLN